MCVDSSLVSSSERLSRVPARPDSHLSLDCLSRFCSVLHIDTRIHYRHSFHQTMSIRKFGQRMTHALGTYSKVPCSFTNHDCCADELRNRPVWSRILGKYDTGDPAASHPSAPNQLCLHPSSEGSARAGCLVNQRRRIFSLPTPAGRVCVWSPPCL